MLISDGSVRQSPQLWGDTHCIYYEHGHSNNSPGIYTSSMEVQFLSLVAFGLGKRSAYIPASSHFLKPARGSSHMAGLRFAFATKKRKGEYPRSTQGGDLNEFCFVCSVLRPVVSGVSDRGREDRIPQKEWPLHRSTKEAACDTRNAYFPHNAMSVCQLPISIFRDVAGNSAMPVHRVSSPLILPRTSPTVAFTARSGSSSGGRFAPGFPHPSHGRRRKSS